MFDFEDYIKFEVDTSHKHVGLAYYLQGSGKTIGYWCKIVSFSKKKMTLYVINGAWSLELDRETNLSVPPYEGAVAVWSGNAPFSEKDYTAAMEWIQKEWKNAA